MLIYPEKQYCWFGAYHQALVWAQRLLWEPYCRDRAYKQWSSHYSCNDETSYSVYALNSARLQWTENIASHCNKTHKTATYTCTHEPTTLHYIWPAMRHPCPWPTKKICRFSACSPFNSLCVTTQVRINIHNMYYITSLNTSQEVHVYLQYFHLTHTGGISVWSCAVPYLFALTEQLLDFLPNLWPPLHQDQQYS